MLEVLFFSDGKISDTNIPYRIANEISRNKSIKIKFLTFTFSGFLKLIYKSLKVKFKKKNMIIHTHHFKGALFVFMLTKIINTNNFCQFKWFHTLHYEVGRFHGIKKILNYLVYRNCFQLIGVNHEISSQWKNFLGIKNILTILNGLSKNDISIIDDSSKLKSKKINSQIRLLWVGRLESVKNPFLIIESLYKLNLSNSIKLLIIGYGSLTNKLNNQIEIFNKLKKNKKINIELITKLDRNKVLNEFGNAEIYINTSRSEAFCTSALEALVNKNCFLILPDIKTLNSLYKFKNVIFYKKNSPEDLANTINKVISNFQSNLYISRLDKIPENFKLEFCAERYIKTYFESYK